MENPDALARSTFVKDFAKVWHDRAVTFAEPVDPETDTIVTDAGPARPDGSRNCFTTIHRGEVLHCRIMVNETTGRCGVFYKEAGPVEAFDQPTVD